MRYTRLLPLLRPRYIVAAPAFIDITLLEKVYFTLYINQDDDITLFIDQVRPYDGSISMEHELTLEINETVIEVGEINREASLDLER